DLTALSGDAVERQSSKYSPLSFVFIRISSGLLLLGFTKVVIDIILSMYRGTMDPPQSVLLVGHSLGVISVLNLLSNPEFDQRKIITVFALAGPLLDPIFSPGPRMDLVYDKIGRYFFTLVSNSSSSSSLVLLSLTGGSPDFLVPDMLGRIDFRFTELNVLSLSTSAVSYAWAPCDHLCILWCRQLVYALTSALLDMKFTSPAVTENLILLSDCPDFYWFFVSPEIMLSHLSGSIACTNSTAVAAAEVDYASGST
ncbi:GPI inositol-deacylase, partial [Clonorchis sinensis]